jgi:hypothetical protein
LAVEERGTLFSGVEWWQVSMIERIWKCSGGFTAQHAWARARAPLKFFCFPTGNTKLQRFSRARLHRSHHSPFLSLLDVDLLLCFSVCFFNFRRLFSISGDEILLNPLFSISGDEISIWIADRLRQISIIFLGFRFLGNFDLGIFDLFLWYYWCLMCSVFILYNDFILLCSK